jgi:hypothetical protein
VNDYVPMMNARRDLRRMCEGINRECDATTILAQGGGSKSAATARADERGGEGRRAAGVN